MKAEIFNWFNQFLSREWAVFFTAWLPIVEIRGAIPLAIKLGMDPLKAYIIGVAGNMVPVVPLLLLLQPVRRMVIKYSSLGRKFFNWLDKRTLEKSDKVEKYGALGLILFTAIPFPTTGAWTASLAAVLFKVRFRYAFPAIMLGVLLAGVLMLILSLTGKAIL